MSSNRSLSVFIFLISSCLGVIAQDPVADPRGSTMAGSSFKVRKDWFPIVPPLPAPAGNVIHVSSVDALEHATQAATPGTTIMIADGHYRLSRRIELKA